jgi:two-component system sensor kinase FixL
MSTNTASQEPKEKISPNFSPDTQQKNGFRTSLSRFIHEIRNPLSLIDSELQLLSSAHPELSLYPDWEIILDNLSYIKELLNDFSSYNNAGVLSPCATPFSEYLKNLIQSVRPTLSYLDICLVTDIPEHLPTLAIDQMKFRQAFLNLIRNAQEALPSPGGQIKISCEALDDSRILLTISDNGCGMTPEQLSNIFTPFITYKKEGTGLGLPISREIIEAHGGRMEAESTPGQGSTFRIFLG